MEIETKTKDKTEVSFKAGDIIALKADSNFNKTTETNFYLIGLSNVEDCDDYYLTDIKTGVTAKITLNNSLSYKRFFNKEDLATIIRVYDGKVYQGDKAKLILEENN